MRGSSLLARPPPSKPVEPSSPVPASSSIFFLREGMWALLEDPAEVVKLLRYSTRFPDHIRERNHLDVPVATDRNHAALDGDDQLHGCDSVACLPDPVRRARRASALQVPENRDPGFESGLAFDIAG